MKTYLYCATFKNMENAEKHIAIYNDVFITRRRRKSNGRVKVYWYEPGFTKLKDRNV